MQFIPLTICQVGVFPPLVFSGMIFKLCLSFFIFWFECKCLFFIYIGEMFFLCSKFKFVFVIKIVIVLTLKNMFVVCKIDIYIYIYYIIVHFAYSFFT